MEGRKRVGRAVLVRVAPTLAVFLIGLFLTSILYSKALIDEDLDTARELATLGRGVVDHVATELSTKVIQQELLGTQFQSTRAGVSLASVAAYSVPLGDTIGVLSWVPKVDHAERSSFESQISDLYRPDLHKNLTITERVNGELRPAAARATYFPVTLVAPLATNEAAILFDLYSNPARKAALQAAQASGATKVTARIQLVQDQGPPLSAVLMLSPVFTTPVTTPGGAPFTPRGPLLGYISSVFRLPTLLRPVIAQRAASAFNFTVTVHDVTDAATAASPGGSSSSGSGGVFLHAMRSDGRSVAEAALPSAASVVYRDTVSVGGRLWAVRLHVLQSSRDSVRTGNPTALLAVSLLVTVVLTLFVFQTSEQHRRTLRRRGARAAQREKAVAAEAARRAHLLTLGYACHELRNPLHVIGACCAELRLLSLRGGIPWVEELGDIAAASVHMKAVVDDILDLDKLREGKLHIQPRPMRMRAVVEGCVTQYHHLSKVPVRAEVHSAVPTWVELDPSRVRQVLNNALSNAAQHTRAGEIVVTVAVEERELALPPHAAPPLPPPSPPLVEATEAPTAVAAAVAAAAARVEEKAGEHRGQNTFVGSGGNGSSRLSAVVPTDSSSSGADGAHKANRRTGATDGSGAAAAVDGKVVSGKAAIGKAAIGKAAIGKAAGEKLAGERAALPSATLDTQKLEEASESESEAGQALVLRVEVVDTGVGFGDVDPEGLFEDFFQGGSNSSATAEAGAGSQASQISKGLGLGTCRKLVGLMGGQVGLVRRGECTHFWMLLPTREARPPLYSPSPGLPRAITPKGQWKIPPLEAPLPSPHAHLAAALQSVVSSTLRGEGRTFGARQWDTPPAAHSDGDGDGDGGSGGGSDPGEESAVAATAGGVAAVVTPLPASPSLFVPPFSSDAGGSVVGEEKGSVPSSDDPETQLPVVTQPMICTAQTVAEISAAAESDTVANAVTTAESAAGVLNESAAAEDTATTEAAATDAAVTTETAAAGAASSEGKGDNSSGSSGPKGGPSRLSLLSIKAVGSTSHVGAPATPVTEPGSDDRTKGVRRRHTDEAAAAAALSSTRRGGRGFAPAVAASEREGEGVGRTAGRGRRGLGKGALRGKRSLRGQRGQRRTKSSATAVAAVAALGLHVLVVEDEAVNRRLACRMLTRLGCTVQDVADGDQVLAALDAAASCGRPFSVVMSDINMVRMGGEALAPALKAHPTYHALPLLAVTGNTSQSDVARYLSLGFLSVLPKPFSIREMQALLSPLSTSDNGGNSGNNGNRSGSSNSNSSATPPPQQPPLQPMPPSPPTTCPSAPPPSPPAAASITPIG